jgi:hypothetical protein
MVRHSVPGVDLDQSIQQRLPVASGEVDPREDSFLKTISRADEVPESLQLLHRAAVLGERRAYDAVTKPLQRMARRGTGSRKRLRKGRIGIRHKWVEVIKRLFDAPLGVEECALRLLGGEGDGGIRDVESSPEDRLGIRACVEQQLMLLRRHDGAAEAEKERRAGDPKKAIERAKEGVI